jgi:hypothetical protein
VTAFAIPESYALITRNGQSLSQKVWDLEDLSQGQSFFAWDFAHYAVGSGLAILLTWLLGHLLFGLWR